MKDKTQSTGVRFPSEVLANTYLLADELGSNKSQVIISGTEWITSLDAGAIKRISEISKELDISESEFVKNAITKRMAEIDANLEVYGKASIGYKGDPTSLYNRFKYDFVKSYEREILKTVVAAEKKGEDLTELQRKIAIKYRYGNAWLNSEEYQEELRRQKEIEELEGQIEPEFDENETITQEEIDNQ